MKSKSKEVNFKLLKNTYCQKKKSRFSQILPSNDKFLYTLCLAILKITYFLQKK